MARSPSLALLALVAVICGAPASAADPAATSQIARKGPVAAVWQGPHVAIDDFGRAEIRNVLGSVLAQSSVGNGYMFQGRRLDAETGLLYFRARYYDPATGRFISRDPVWDPNNVGNAYSFVGNNPVTLTDPSGETPLFLLFAIAGAIGWGGSDLAAQYSTTDHFRAGDWDYGSTARYTAGGAAIGASGGLAFGAGVALAGPGLAGALTGGVLAGGTEGAVSWGFGMAGDQTLAESVGYGALFGGLTAGVVHGAGAGLGALRGGMARGAVAAGESGSWTPLSAAARRRAEKLIESTGAQGLAQGSAMANRRLTHSELLRLSEYYGSELVQVTEDAFGRNVSRLFRGAAEEAEYLAGRGLKAVEHTHPGRGPSALRLSQTDVTQFLSVVEQTGSSSATLSVIARSAAGRATLQRWSVRQLLAGRFMGLF